MSSFGVKSFRNRDNFAKHLLFYYETGTRVLLTTLKWLYQGSVEDFVLNLPKNKWNGTERATLEDLKNGLIQLEDFDLSFLYKIIKLTDVFSGEDEILWTKRCPKFRRVELAHLLFVLKTGRNNLAHPSIEQKNLADLDVKTKSEELKHLLTSILEKAGERGDVPPLVISEMIKFVEHDIQRIYRDENTDSSISPHVKNLIVNDLRSVEIDSSFVNEHQGYSMPYFHIQSEPQTSYHTKNIFTICDSASIIVVIGEAGDGKSALTRFISNSWNKEKMETIESLSTFDIVLRVECKRICSRDVSQFLEDHLSVASFSFQNTSSLKRHLVPFRVLWIMDGYDERTPEFDGFLAAILQELSDEHKIIITTRPTTLNDLQKLLSRMEVQTISLEKLREENIDEIISNRINDDNSRVIFKSEFSAIGEEGKSLLRTPLNVNLYIELWLEDPTIAKGWYAADILFTKVTYLQLNQLSRRLEGRTPLSNSDDLNMNINKWFYRYLCRETFLLAMQRKHVIPSVTNYALKNAASNFYLIPSDCLSTFLVKDDINGYDFAHPIQIHVLSSLYMTYMEEYPIEDSHWISFEFNDMSTYVAVYELLKFYMRVITFDKSLSQKAEQLFFSVKKIISLFESKTQYALWFEVGTACNYDSRFMCLIAQMLDETQILNDPVSSAVVKCFKNLSNTEEEMQI